MGTMHDGEFDITVPLVERLLSTRFPRWADLPLTPVEPSGTDHAIFRLGTDLAVRLPRIGWAADQPAKEHAWLPRLAPHLPLAVPLPLALAEPGDGYPFAWLVSTWVPGGIASPDRIGDPDQAADDLAHFILHLQGLDTSGGPAPEGRGGPLAPRDAATREAIAVLGDAIDTRRVLALWEDALAAPAWSERPVWIHGDLDARNLLATDGRLSGVLDFGALAVGDPAADAMVAWKLFHGDVRERFLDRIGGDVATRRRARGWALSQGLLILSYYTTETNPTLVNEAARWLRELLSDDG